MRALNPGSESGINVQPWFELKSSMKMGTVVGVGEGIGVLVGGGLVAIERINKFNFRN